MVPEQLSLEGLPQPVQHEPKRVAFGRYLKPEQYDIFGDYDLSTVTDEEKAWMTPENLSRIVFVDEKQQRGKDGLYIDGVLVNQYEYRLIPRSPLALGKASLSRVLGDKEVNEEVVQTAQRGRIHVLEDKVEAMAAHRAKLSDRRATIVELQHAAQKPGFSIPRRSPEEVKQMFGEAWQEFTNILDTLQIQRGWTEEQRIAANGALINYLTQGSQRDRVHNWKQMLELSRKYLVARDYILNTRTRQTQTLINTYSAGIKPKDDKTD